VKGKFVRSRQRHKLLKPFWFKFEQSSDFCSVSANSSMKSVAVGIAFAFLSAGCGACEFDVDVNVGTVTALGYKPGNVSLSTMGLPSECCSWASQCISTYPNQLEPSSDCTSKLANMESFVLEESFNGGICSGPVCSIDNTTGYKAETSLLIRAYASNPYALIRPQLSSLDLFSPMSDQCCSQWQALGAPEDLSDECKIPLLALDQFSTEFDFKDFGPLCFRASDMVKLNPENGCFRQAFTQTLI